MNHSFHHLIGKLYQILEMGTIRKRVAKDSKGAVEKPGHDRKIGKTGEGGGVKDEEV